MFIPFDIIILLILSPFILILWLVLWITKKIVKFVLIVGGRLIKLLLKCFCRVMVAIWKGISWLCQKYIF